MTMEVKPSNPPLNGASLDLNPTKRMIRSIQFSVRTGKENLSGVGAGESAVICEVIERNLTK
jgi:hypothetical protein